MVTTYCVPHSKTSCDKCRKAYERDHDWGVFLWENENMYRRANAVKVYKRKCDAVNAVEKMLGNYVVRPLTRK